MRRQKIALMVSMLCRIGVGLASIIVLAHGLTSMDYGFVVTVLAWSAIAALLTDFGFGVQALRDIGARPDQAGSVMSECLRVKMILSGLATFITFGILFYLQLPEPLFVASLILYASLMITSFSDLFAVALRGVGRYETEAVATLAGGIFFALIVTLTAMFSPNLISLSIAVFLGRLSQFVFQMVAFRRHVKLAPIFSGNIREMLHFIMKSSPLALDTVLTVLIQQVDVILVSSMLGLEAAASYQVISRTAMYFLLPAQVLAGVYMPRLAADARNDAKSLVPMELRMQREFVIFGCLMGAAFFVIPFVIREVLPPEFQVEASIIIALSVFIFMRYSASSFGCSLTIRHKSGYRLIGQISGFLVLFGVMPYGILQIGLVAAPITLAISSLTTLLAYIWLWFKSRRQVEAL